MGCAAHKKCEVLVLVGSASRKSIHAGIVQEIQRIPIEDGLKLTLTIPSLDRLPIFSEDEQRKLISNREVARLRKRAQQADAIMLVTPQINGSLSPLLLNALVWLLRGGNESPLLYKKAGVVSASYLSENQIVDCIQIGKAVGMRFMNQPFYLFLGNKVTNEQGTLTSPYEKTRLQQWYRQFLLFVLAD